MDAESHQKIFDWLSTSGQLSPADIALLASQGFKTIINLALPTASNALPGEAELVTGLGINYFQIPVPWEKPELRHLSLFFALMDAMHGQATWVHCAKNMRVSAFVYLYRRIRLQQSEAACLPLLHAVWEPNPIWAQFIADALDNPLHSAHTMGSTLPISSD